MPESSVALRQQLTDLIIRIFRANGTLVTWGDRFAAPFGLTSARWQMLGALALSSEALTAPQIAANMGVTRQGAQKQLNLLLKEGMVERQPNPLNKRSPTYRLSTAGNSLYRRIESGWNQHADKISRNLSADELTVTAQALETICELHLTPDEETT